MTFKTITMAISCLIIAGCSASEQRWDSTENKTDQEFYGDRAACSAMAKSPSSNVVYYDPSPSGLAEGFINGLNVASAGQSDTDRGIFNDCMMGRGWFLTTSNTSSAKSAGSGNATVMAALYRTQYLRDWYDNKDPKFEYAMDIDDRLKNDPHWKSRPLDERFAEVTRLTIAHYNIDTESKTNKKSSNNPVVDAINKTAYLKKWYYEKSPKFDYAVDVDDKLKEDPEWGNKSLEERFAEATRLTRVHFGEISQ